MNGLRLLFLVAVLSAVALMPAGLHAADRAVCFNIPGVSDCIDGRMIGYWSNNGALSVFGYPRTSAADEWNRDKESYYFTQWFERNRFELHPENPEPYNVLLGRLGDERLRQLGVFWESRPREPGPLPGCLWFEQTGRNVCDWGDGLSFKTYWETHGLADPRLSPYERSLALFGLPLTSPNVETNANGDRVLTQWFERARFEWHPTNPDGYKVLLGLLGDEIRAAGRLAGVPALTGECAANAPQPANGLQAWLTDVRPADDLSMTMCVRLIMDGHAIDDAMLSGYVRYRASSQPWLGPIPTGKDGIAKMRLEIGDAPQGQTSEVDAFIYYLGRSYQGTVAFVRP